MTGLATRSDRPRESGDCPGLHAVVPLSQLEVLVVDCQATAAAPRGHLLELGWVRLGRSTPCPRACLIALADGERIPPAVARITGISEQMVRHGVHAGAAWRDLSDEAATFGQQPAPTVIHFARFEQPFLCSLAGGTPPLDVVCTHDIARRLLPDLPRRSLRALAGYFGRAVGALRRSADHVEATAFVWRELVRLLDAAGVSTWAALQEWLAGPVDSTKRARRVWPMPRDLRLALPDAPGIYRLLRTTGDVLYVGRASSLHRRVNSYFRHQRGVPERMLEMLSQVRDLSIEVSPSTLEAALLEADEIKRHRPPYNVALAGEDRGIWFTPPDLSERSSHASSRFRIGPFSSDDMLDQFSALARGNPAALGRGRWVRDVALFNAGYTRLCADHRELSRNDVRPHARLLRLGTRLWREGRRDRRLDEDGATGDGSVDAWTPEEVQFSLERLTLRAAHARRRARWLTCLVDAAVRWREPGAAGARLIVLESGEIAFCGAIDCGGTPPIPPGHERTNAERRASFTLARFDRLRVLTTELKRLVADGASVAVRFGAARALADARLAAALSWV
jgi:DNA polymerase-3 subunit epsilon